jgi:hypothetical protein
MPNTVNQIRSSAITAFKTCPIKYRLSCLEGLREAVEPQHFRMGTAWHKGLEILGSPAGAQIPVRIPGPNGVGEHDGFVIVSDENRVELAVEAATAAYATIPDSIDSTDWAVERETVAVAVVAYNWLHPQDEYEIVATEVEFDLPLVNPETGRPSTRFRRGGRIDRIVRNKATGALLIGENKTTSRPIDSGSTYWARLRKDTQSKFYIVAGRDMQSGTKTADFTDAWDRGPLVSGLLHDVFHKPQISPKKLTQAESAEFRDNKTYYGQTFELGITEGVWSVDGIPAETEHGKKAGTFAIRETPGMFGARLLQAMTSEPEKYFARREVAFTDQELLDFQYQVWAIQKNIADMERTGRWYECEANCEPMGGGKCCYLPICYSNVQCCDGATTPPGFRRMGADEAASRGIGVQD